MRSLKKQSIYENDIKNHHIHAHIENFHESLFAHKSYLKQYHDKLVIACKHDWQLLELPIKQIWGKIHSNRNQIIQDMNIMLTEFTEHFGIVDRLYRF